MDTNGGRLGQMCIRKRELAFQSVCSACNSKWTSVHCGALVLLWSNACETRSETRGVSYRHALSLLSRLRKIRDWLFDVRGRSEGCRKDPEIELSRDHTGN